jgi:flavin-dependent dehydrogenase
LAPGCALLVGAAADGVDALTGEGLRLGFAEAEAAVRAMVIGDPGGYEAQWRAVTRSYRWLTNSLIWTASRRELRPMVVPAVRALPLAFRHIVAYLPTEALVLQHR